MDDVVDVITADLARQREDIELEQERRAQRGEDLTEVLESLRSLRTRMEKLKKDHPPEEARRR